MATSLEWTLLVLWVVQVAAATELLVRQGLTLQLKLWQLVLAASAVALAFRSYRGSQTHGGTIPAIIWPFWATTATAALALFGQELLWDLRGGQGRLPSAGLASNDASIEAYVALLALIISAVTGFYLVLLHRSQDAAQKAVADIRDDGRRLIDDVRSNAQDVRDRANRFVVEAEDQINKSRRHTDELEAVLGAGTTLYGVTTARHIALLSETILPILSRLDSLFRSKTPVPSEEDIAAFKADLDPQVQKIQAEVSLFQLAHAPDGDHFLERWDQVRAFEGLFRGREYQPLFRLVRRRLEQFVNRHDGDRRRALMEISRVLQEYEETTRAQG